MCIKIIPFREYFSDCKFHYFSGIHKCLGNNWFIGKSFVDQQTRNQEKNSGLPEIQKINIQVRFYF